MNLETVEPKVRAMISQLEAEIESLTAEKREQEALANRLIREEDHTAGKYFASEIHAAKQNRQRLDVEIQLRRNRVNRLVLGIDEGPAPGVLM